MFGFEVITRYTGSHFVFFTLCMVDSQRELAEIGPPPLYFCLFRRGTVLKCFHRLLVTEPHNRVSAK